MRNYYDTLIINGRVFVSSDLYNISIGIKNGKIAALGYLDNSIADQIVDAKNNLVLPGMIDPHVHFSDYDPDSTFSAVDNFYTASVAAAFGGDTTVIDFAISKNDTAIRSSFNNRRASADGEIVVDYSLHGTVDQNIPVSQQDLSELNTLGTNSVKVFTTFGRMKDERELFNLFSDANKYNISVLLHAENHSLIEGFETVLASEKKNDNSFFHESRPEISEVLEVQKAIMLAEYTGATIYIVHVSTGKAIQLIREAKNRGVSVYAETGPHYLVLDNEVYHSENGFASLCCPPLRTETDNNLLWYAVADGTISTIGSDHCGFSYKQRMVNMHNYRKNIKGFPTVEVRVPIIFSEGVVKKRISLNQFVNIMSTNVAKIFGLYPQKGELLPGFDADICIIDPNYKWKISSETLQVDYGWSPYENMSIIGKPVMTIVRGKKIVDRGNFSGDRGYGQFLNRCSIDV